MSQVHVSLIASQARLDALRRLELLDNSAEPALDRLTQLAARILKVPVTLISFVDDHRQFFKGLVGLPEPWATLRETPLSHSFCQYAVESGAALIIDDARTHPLVQNNLAIPDLNIIAYAGIPLITREGYTLGTLCAIDSVPRTCTDDEISILTDLAASVMTEIELRAEIIERKHTARTTHILAEQRKRLLEIVQTLVSTLTIDEILPKLQRMFREISEHDALSVYWLDEAAGVLQPAHIISPPWLSDAVSTWPIPLQSGIAGAVGRSGRAEMVNNAHLDHRSTYPPGTSKAQPHHLICAPIKANSHIIGILIMSRSGGRPFSEQEFQLVQLLVSYVGLAIENARLFEQTRESEERFRLLSEVSFEGIAIHDHGVILDANAAQATLLGYEPGEIIGMNVLQFARPESREIILRNISAGNEEPYEVVGLRKDGTTLPIEVQARPFTYRGHTVRNV